MFLFGDNFSKVSPIFDPLKGAQSKLLEKTLISPPVGLIVQADPDYPDIVQLNWAFNKNVTRYR